jgi:hypothetical protein
MKMVMQRFTQSYNRRHGRRESGARGDFGLKRKTGARKPKYGQWGDLCTMRDLRPDPVSLPKAA